MKVSLQAARVNAKLTQSDVAKRLRKNKQTIVLSLKSPLTKRACKIIPTIFELKSFMNYKGKKSPSPIVYKI